MLREIRKLLLRFVARPHPTSPRGEGPDAGSNLLTIAYTVASTG
jgi:hypothetical protein